MGVSRIEQLIEDIYEFIEGCKMSPLSSTKVVVPKDQLYDLLDELRLRTPDEIKRYQKIIANRDSIISDAEEKAATMLAEAQEKTNELISNHEIVQQAYQQAQQIVDQAQYHANEILTSANNDANQIRTGSLAYSSEMLEEVEKLFEDAVKETKNRYSTLIAAVEENLNTVKTNRKEITDQLYPESNDEVAAFEQEEEEVADDFEMDENEYSEDEEE